MKLLRSLRNDHHWQWWILPEDDGGTKILPMSRDARLELIADWIGAGMAISGRKDPWPWYQENKDKMRLHPETRCIIEENLKYISRCPEWSVKYFVA